VQYPGIDRAIENDLKSLSMLETMIAPIGRKYQSKEALDEIKQVLLAEIDYGREAEAADLFRRVHEGDRDIVIPQVVHSLSSKRVLTLELIGGVDYATFAERAPQADRDAAGVTLMRFMFRALWSHGLLYADPHPGNYRFLGGGRVAFLDFGCHRVIPPHLIEGMKRYIVALQRGDMDGFHAACVEVLGYDPDDHDSWALYTEYTKLILGPLVMDAPFKYTKEFARETVAFLVRGGRKLVLDGDGILPRMPSPVKAPPEFTFVNRLQWGFASVLAGLGSEAPWKQIVEPWLHGPVTSLGREPVPSPVAGLVEGKDPPRRSGDPEHPHGAEVLGELLEVLDVRGVDDVATLGGRSHDHRIDGRRATHRREGLTRDLRHTLRQRLDANRRDDRIPHVATPAPPLREDSRGDGDANLELRRALQDLARTARTALERDEGPRVERDPVSHAAFRGFLGRPRVPAEDGCRAHSTSKRSRSSSVRPGPPSWETRSFIPSSSAASAASSAMTAETLPP